LDHWRESDLFNSEEKAALEYALKQSPIRTGK